MSQTQLQTILVVGATGNTGKNVVHTLAKELNKGEYRILALSRSLESEAAQALSKVEGVEMEEMDWTRISSEWLKSRNVVKVFIASHNGPTQFTDENGFFYAALHGGVKYVVRISTTAFAVGPASTVYYGRTHWAIENMLSQPAFKALQWTSLQPPIFHSYFAGAAIDFVKEFKKTGKQPPVLKLLADERVGGAIIDPSDVGLCAGRLLALQDSTPHNNQIYVIGGPEDINGQDIIKVVEKIIGEKVENVDFRSIEFFDDMVEHGMIEARFKSLLVPAITGLWDGKIGKAEMPTSQAVLDLAEPKTTFETAFTALTA